MASQWGKGRNSDRLFSWTPKSLQVVTAAMKLKDACSLKEKLWQTSQHIKKWSHHFANKDPYQFSPQLCLTLCNPMNRSTQGFPIYRQLTESTQTHVHWIGDAIQPSHPLLSPSPPALNLFQHQGLFKWVSSSYQVAKVLEFQLQHQSFQWTLRTDFL